MSLSHFVITQTCGARNTVLQHLWLYSPLLRVCVCVRTCVRVCVREFLCVCVRARACVCMRVSGRVNGWVGVRACVPVCVRARVRAFVLSS